LSHARAEAAPTKLRMGDGLLGECVMTGEARVVELTVLTNPDEEMCQLFDELVELIALNLQLTKGARA
jgi:hypothetical protein